jgi:hypothetical protein
MKYETLKVPAENDRIKTVDGNHSVQRGGFAQAGFISRGQFLRC